MASPKNKDEWVSYILNEIPSEELMNQAQVIGTPAFQRMMEEEGMEPDDLLSLYRAVTLRFIRDGRRVPRDMEGVVVNYHDIALSNIPSDLS